MDTRANSMETPDRCKTLDAARMCTGSIREAFNLWSKGKLEFDQA